MKRYLTLGQVPPCIFLPPSSPTRGPAAHSELRAAPSTTDLARQEATPLPDWSWLLCSVQVLANSVQFLVASVVPTLDSHPLPAQAKPARMYSGTVRRQRGFEPGWPGKAVEVDGALSWAVSTCPHPFHAPPCSHQKEKNSGCFSLSIALCFNKQFAVTLCVGIEFELDCKEVRWGGGKRETLGSFGCTGSVKSVGAFVHLATSLAF